jgi:hypothetical protein
MYKKLLILIISALVFGGVNTFSQFAKSKLPNYLKPEYKAFYLSHPEIVNPLQMVKWKPIPPEWAKYKPEQTVLQNDAGFSLINITNGNDAQSETWIAINPKDPNNIIATANDNHYLSGYQNWRMNSWVTFDGGQTWNSSPTPPNLNVYIAPPANGGMTIFDPGIAFNTQGQAVYTYGYCQVLSSGATDGVNGVFAVSSTDGGKSWYGWGQDYPISAISLSSNESAPPFNDRYTLACDNVSNTAYKDRFYVTWQRFIANPGITFAYSTDYGASWSSPIILGTGSTQAPMPAVGPDGEVYVAWVNSIYPDEEQAIVKKTTNGGLSWNSSIMAQSVYSIGTMDSQSGRFTLVDKQGMRVSSPPQIAVDCSNKSSRGYVYVVQAGRVASGGANHIYLSRSTDGGKTWHKSQIDDNAVGNDMFFPSITVDRITGMVSVFYYSSQNDPTKNQGVDGYLAFSKDAGNSWNILRVTPSTFYIDGPEDVMPQGPGNVYWGDYTSITSYNGVVYPLFWMPTSPTGNYFSLDLFTAPISSQPAPVKNLTAQNVINGNNIKVKLTWTNPQYDLLNNLLGDFNVQIYRNDVPGNPIATINKSNPSEYTDANVTDGTFYTYTLKVVTTDNRVSTPTMVSILVGGALKPNVPSNLSWKPLADGVNLSWTNPSTAIDGTPVRDLKAINIYVNGKLNQTILQDNTQAGNNVTAKINMEPKTFAKVYISAVATRNGTDAESDFTDSYIVYAGSVFSTISENFDDTNNVTPHYTENGWSITNEVSYSAPNCLASSPNAKYQINTNYELYFPPLVITPENQSLIFEHICLVHNTDVAQVSVTNNWGKTFKGLAWYDVNSSSGFVRNDVANSQWAKAAVDLRPFIGDTIMLRFSLFSGPALTDEGWFIDNINFDNTVGVDENPPIVNNLIYVYPNPSSDYINVNFTLSKASSVSIEVYDLLGNKLKSMDLGYLEQNNNAAQIDIKDLPTGNYFLNLNSNGKQLIKAISIVR